MVTRAEMDSAYSDDALYESLIETYWDPEDCKTKTRVRRVPVSQPKKAPNPSGISPVEYNVLVKPKDVEEKTQGGLYIPDDTREREQYGQMEGVLIAVSPAAFTFNYEGWPEDGRLPKVGDTVVFSRYQATEIKGADGAKYWLMKDKSIAGVKQ